MSQIICNVTDVHYSAKKPSAIASLLSLKAIISAGGLVGLLGF